MLIVLNLKHSLFSGCVNPTRYTRLLVLNCDRLVWRSIHFFTFPASSFPPIKTSGVLFSLEVSPSPSPTRPYPNTLVSTRTATLNLSISLISFQFPWEQSQERESLFLPIILTLHRPPGSEFTSTWYKLHQSMETKKKKPSLKIRLIWNDTWYGKSNNKSHWMRVQSMTSWDNYKSIWLLSK